MKTSGKPLIVVGAGDHARVLIDTLEDCGALIHGIVDQALPAGHEGPFGHKVIGNDEALNSLPRESFELVNGLGSIDTASLARRAGAYDQLVAKGWTFATVVHPQAFVSKYAEIGPGAQIMPRAAVCARATIGENSLINTSAIIEHDVKIARHVVVSSGAVLAGAIEVGELTHFGSAAFANGTMILGAVAVLQYVKIGKGCLIGMGAIVLRDVPDGTKVIGRWPPPREFKITDRR
ncbi:MAG TPA: acetyltransferase [Alphaproteobacteria bacterium]